MGQPERAIDDFDEAIRLSIISDTEMPYDYLLRSTVNTLLGRDAEALQDMVRAVELEFGQRIFPSGPLD